jgi:transposase
VIGRNEPPGTGSVGRVVLFVAQDAIARHAADANDSEQQQIAIGMPNVAWLGSLVKILWHDGIVMSLYAKRLERGRFIWPSVTSGIVSISASQLAYRLDGIDWRNPQHSWRPTAAD